MKNSNIIFLSILSLLFWILFTGESPAASHQITLSGLDKNSKYSVTNLSTIVTAICAHEFYNNNGLSLWTFADQIDPGGTKIYNLADMNMLSDGYSGYVIIASDQLIEGTVLPVFRLFLPILSKGVNRFCPGGPGSPPTLYGVILMPNVIPANSNTQVYVQFSFSDPDGDLDNGTFNYIAPSGQTVSLALPGNLAGITTATIGAYVIITTDNQKGTFSIPTWLVDKAGNCSNIVSVDWTQY
jgi:hypothetical protein